MTTVPTTNAMATEAKIAKIICRHFSSLMYSSKGQVKKELLLKIAMPMAAPSKENTNATVVDVGNPSVLKVSSKMMFATITAKNSSMTSWKREHLRFNDSVSCNRHHTTGEACSENDADGCNTNGLIVCSCVRTDRGIQEVTGIVADADD